MRKNIIFIIFMLLLLPVAFSEIVVETMEGPSNGHQFIVNKYYFQQFPVPEDESSAIFIRPNVTEQTISQCSQAEFSFLLANPTYSAQTYSVGITDFKGTAYLPPHVIIPAREIRKINLILAPDCTLSGNFNPKIVVETAAEEAQLPLLLNVLPVDIDQTTESECRFYYNTTVCESDYYIRFYQGRRFDLDLGALFFDPDGDRLRYSAEAENLDISIRDSTAVIKPLYDFHGAESVVFYADDGKGGQASSRRFYFHVLDNNRPYLENFIMLNLPLVVGGAVLILLVLMMLIIVVASSRNTREKDEEEMPPAPEPEKEKKKKPKKKDMPKNK